MRRKGRKLDKKKAVHAGHNPVLLAKKTVTSYFSELWHLRIRGLEVTVFI